MNTNPTIRAWLTPARFAAAVPQLATYPLTGISDALVSLRRNGVAVLEGPDLDTVYVVNPTHALLVEVTDHHADGVCLPPPLAGTAQPHLPVPVVDVGAVRSILDTQPVRATTPAEAISAHDAVRHLARASAVADHALHRDSNQDFDIILPSLAATMRHLAGIHHSLVPYCGDYSQPAAARVATAETLSGDCGHLIDLAHHQLRRALQRSGRVPTYQTTDITVICYRHTPWEYVYRAELTYTNLRDEEPDECTGTVTTTRWHPTIADAVDAVRFAAQEMNIRRSDHPDQSPQLHLRTPHGASPDNCRDLLKAEATRLRLRLATGTSTGTGTGTGTGPSDGDAPPR